jgi:hypothetical protein
MLHRSAVHRYSLACAGALAAAAATGASSHREAPFITEMPRLDATDFYLFKSYEPGREGYVTLIANYLPLQDPYGGPNYFSLDPEGVYSIHVDNNGDAVADLTFSFRFTNTLRDLRVPVGGQMVPVALLNIAPFSAGNTAALNVVETYRLSVRFGHGPELAIAHAAGGTTFLKPADNIGEKSIPDYAAYAATHVYDIVIPGCDQLGRVFVGQRKDPFVVNLGEAFDLVNTNPIGPPDGETDDLADKNITALVLEIPASFLRSETSACVRGGPEAGNGGGDPVIGAWTAASLPQTRVLRAQPTFSRPASENGTLRQVSRLGMPLVNELVIGLRDKNLFNASEPRDDGQFALYVTNPTLPVLLNALFGVTAPCLPRSDLVSVFLTGVPGLNQPVAVTPSEMLRLNTTTAPVPKGSQHNLGVLGGDVAGFPNGRRPGDDVVDIALRVVMGALLDNACAPSGQLPYTDGAVLNDSFFDDTFPYLRTPIPGSPAN